jgi:hypothetical protein
MANLLKPKREKDMYIQALNDGGLKLLNELIIDTAPGGVVAGILLCQNIMLDKSIIPYVIKLIYYMNPSLHYIHFIFCTTPHPNAWWQVLRVCCITHLNVNMKP